MRSRLVHYSRRILAAVVAGSCCSPVVAAVVAGSCCSPVVAAVVAASVLLRVNLQLH